MLGVRAPPAVATSKTPFSASRSSTALTDWRFTSAPVCCSSLLITSTVLNFSGRPSTIVVTMLRNPPLANGPAPLVDSWFERSAGARIIAGTFLVFLPLPRRFFDDLASSCAGLVLAAGYHVANPIPPLG